MAQEADYYTPYEAARVLGVSPARVRQLLRAGDLEGERGPERFEGVPGPWRIPASALSAYKERTYRRGRQAVEAAETVALPQEELAPGTLHEDTARDSSEAQRPGEDAPTETSERLSEGVGVLRDKTEEILEELDRLESRLEAAEVENIALLEAARQEKERAEKLQRALEAQRGGRQAKQPGPWRRLFGR